MVTQEQKDRYDFQQTTIGKQVVELLESQKKHYCNRLGIPVVKIKTGKLTPLIHGRTGKLDRFIEE